MINLYILDLENEEDAMLYQNLTNLEINIIPLNQLNSYSATWEMTAITFPSEIKVTLHIPQGVSSNIKQQKINRIYDILKPKHKEGGLYEKNNSYLCAAFC